MNTPELPPLPKPDTHCFDDDTGKDVWSHSPEQTQAYAIAAIEAQGVPDGYVGSTAFIKVMPTVAVHFSTTAQALAFLDQARASWDKQQRALASAPPAPQVVPRKIPTPPAQAEMMDVVYAEGWNQCCDTFFGGLPPQEPVVITITERDEAPAPQADKLVKCSYGDNGYACCEGGPCAADVHNNSVLASAVQQEPLGFISPKQVERIVDPDGEFGAYIPMRKTPAGNFTLAVYTHPSQQAKPQPLSDEQALEIFNDLEKFMYQIEDEEMADEHLAGQSLQFILERVAKAHGIKERPC